MRWQGRKKSENIEDRRRSGGGGKRMAGGIGIGTIIIVVLALLMGENPMRFLQNMNMQPQQTQQQSGQQGAPEDDPMAEFVAVVLNDTEEVWTKLFREQLNRRYEPPTLVLFSGQTRSTCGHASAATGPFYCPADQKVYIDLSFYNDLQNKFGASGDFAMAYVVAHEVAHHVQYLLGITNQVHSQKGRISQKKYNDLSVRLELQADFLSGVWAHHAHKMNNILEKGDIKEALDAAHAIGDDRIQKKTQGYVVPDSFTHGSSEQRVRWFKKGLETGDLSQGETFEARYL
ncbi:UNVERIFIED_CONTAM: hypothetical protein GTU68_001680 [Idotea baltica]|nr:hypothetical protein [Idotea baltica]